MTAIGLSPDQERALLRHDFESFVKMAFAELNPAQRLQMAPYVRLMMARLEDCRAGRIRRLIINLPPRSLKSHCASIAFPAWLLGHAPAAGIIGISHGQELAEKLARDCRRVMNSAWYQNLFSTRIGVPSAVHDFATTVGGGRMATSFGGQLTGRGADFLIIDDPTKAADALSETVRPQANEWFDNTLLSRLNNQATGCIIIVMQRLHQDDLVGHVTGKPDGDNWTVLSFPAIAEEDEEVPYQTLLGRQVYRRAHGEALHPQRETTTDLQRRRQTIDSYTWASQYQQAPIPIGGNLVKTEWLRFYSESELPSRPLMTVQSWDTATKTEHLNDFSVCTTWVLAGDNFYLIDVLRKKLEYPDLKRAVIAQAGRFTPNHILIEDKSSGTSLIQDLRADGIYSQEYKPPPSTDKIMRLFAQTGKFEAGRVLLPKAAHWLDTYIAEITGFPGTRHDDQVDSTTQFLDHYGSKASGLALWAKLGS